MNLKNNLLALLCGSIGGVLGYFAFDWIAGQGFYALILPGALVGFGAGRFPSSSIAIPALCGIMALVIGLFSEWKISPFIADDSLGYFVTHLHELQPITLILLAVGTFVGFWFPFRRMVPARPNVPQ